MQHPRCCEAGKPPFATVSKGSTPASLAGHLDFFTACAQSNAQHSPPESEALKKPARFCRLLPPGRDRPLPVPGTGVLSATVIHMRRSTFDPIP